MGQKMKGNALHDSDVVAGLIAMLWQLHDAELHLAYVSQQAALSRIHVSTPNHTPAPKHTCLNGPCCAPP